ncbi:MAG: nucleotidyltransferase family protein [Nitrososphaerota archaeon]|nr:nucleotidyltransferase family protein [Candidatus Geocrenenecus dongiae]
MLGFILAGGEGTRFRPITYYIQKCMVPIGMNQKPLLEYILLNFKKHGIRDVVIGVGYKAEQIINYFGDGSRIGLKIRYVHDDPNLRGTGGSLLNAYMKDLLGNSGDLLIHYGDILSAMDLSDLIAKHRRSSADVTIVLAPSYELPVGVAEVDEEGRVKAFREKPKINIYVSIGILIMKIQLIREFIKLAEKNQTLDIMSHFIPYLIESNRNVRAYIYDSFWYDVGSIEKYEKLDHQTIEKYFSELLD